MRIEMRDTDSLRLHENTPRLRAHGQLTCRFAVQGDEGNRAGGQGSTNGRAIAGASYTCNKWRSAR